MDIESSPQSIEKPIQNTKLVVVLPAVDVLSLNVEGVLTELFDGVASTAGLSDTSWSEDRGGLSGFTTQYRCEDPREVCELGVTVDYLLGDERILEYAGVGYHIEKGFVSRC